jgi:cytochrome b561
LTIFTVQISAKLRRTAHRRNPVTAAADIPLTARSSYAPGLIAIHWITALAFVFLFTAIEVREYYPKGSEMRDLLMSTHKSFGILILLLALVRVAVRGRMTAPPILPAPPVWQTWAARFTHVVLYGAMIAMPLLGWTMTSAGGHSVPFFGLTLPPIMGVDKELSEELEDIHSFIGNALYFVIGFHAIAALFHHYVMKDNTLLRMVRAQR